jgi:hypothetical protein
MIPYRSHILDLRSRDRRRSNEPIHRLLDPTASQRLSRRALGIDAHAWRPAAAGAILLLTTATLLGCRGIVERPRSRFDPPTSDVSAGSTSGTGSGSAAIGSNGGTPGPGAVFSAHPFDPATMRIHPLTHLQRASDIVGGTPGPTVKPRINCFVEFKDRWGDTCKALGRFQVLLYRPESTPGQERQDAMWEADITDLARNADWFDPVTRSYRLQLEVPDWLGDPGPGGAIKLRLVYTPGTPDGEARRLRDEFIVRVRN